MRISFARVDTTVPLFCESIGYGWQQDTVTRPHGHRYYHWLQSDVGTGTLTIADQRRILAPGQGVLIAPGVPHSYAAHTPSWQTSFFVFGGTLTTSLATWLPLHQYLLVDHLGTNLAHFTREHYNEFASDTVVDAFAQSSVVYQFVMTLKANQQHKPGAGAARNTVSNMISWLTVHYAEPITNTMLAQISGYSISYQDKLFRRFYGVTPRQYLTEYRLRQAKALMMAHPERQIQEIATNVGFADVSRFIQLFRRGNGMTPFVFRAQFR